jgi:hypothetical protein
MGRKRGFIGTLVKISADMERAERRRQRELQAAVKSRQRATAASQKAAELEDAQREAELFENTIHLLTSMHRECSERIDWIAILEAPPPREPERNTHESFACRASLEVYTPGFFERLFGAEKKRRLLEANLEAALAREAELFENARKRHEAALVEHREAATLARTVLAADVAAYARVIDETGCLEELDDLRCSVEARFPGAQFAHATVRADGRDLVPSEVKTLSAKGKLSAKEMPKARFWEIYQDFICGAALRVARELCAVLPLKGALIDVRAPLLNSATGHYEDTCVLSVYCPAEELDRINFSAADASSVVESFMHEMAFAKSKGMNAVDSIPAGKFA